ncbi:MAG: rhomboid family intramembrane serine protease [Planctomycetota bacterium]
MGIAQRDYMRGRPSSPFSFRPGRLLGVVPVIIGLNLVVFLLWILAGPGSDLYAFMVNHFMVSLAHLRVGHPWTPLTSAFSHNLFWHLLINMFVLFSFGRVLETVWGPRRFAIFYLVACVVAGFTHCGLSLLGWEDGFALGASGGVSGLIMAYSLLYPRSKILLLGILPLPALVLALLFVGVDLLGLFAQLSPGGGLPIGHGAHLGGAACGALAILLARMRILPGLGGAPRRSTSARLYAPSPSPLGRSPQDDARLDQLLSKVSTEGLDSLTPQEREFLIRMGERQQRGPDGGAARG